MSSTTVKIFNFITLKEKKHKATNTSENKRKLSGLTEKEMRQSMDFRRRSRERD